MQAALAAHTGDPAALHTLRTTLAHPLTDMRAAGNLLTGPQDAAGLLAAVRSRAGPATLRAAADTLAVRPDLPLPAAVCDRIVNQPRTGRHELAVDVYAARQTAGLDAPVSLALTDGPPAHIRTRADAHRSRWPTARTGLPRHDRDRSLPQAGARRLRLTGPDRRPAHTGSMRAGRPT